MKPLSRFSTIAFVASALFVFYTCTDAGLQPKPSPMKKIFDNLLTIKGEYCVQPDTLVEFPVKVLLVVDQSASLQCTDNPGRRFEALNGVVGQILRNQSAQIGVIGFSSWTRYTPFTHDINTARTAAGDTQGGIATDYQGALATVLRVVENDILVSIESDPGLPARTRYVVVFVSDGIPEPRCLPGCEDDQDRCVDGIDNDSDGSVDRSDDDCRNIGDNLLHPDNLYAICNYTGDPDSDSDDPFDIRQVLEDDEYVDFDAICPSYNEPELILKRVSDLIDLQDTYSVGNIALHSVFLFAPQEEVTAVCGEVASTFGYEQTQARNLLQAMAVTGTGAFRDVNIRTAADNNFLQFDYRALQKPIWTSSFMVRNLYATLTRDGYEPDIDADGLGDAVELDLGTNYKERDSDATDITDGYTDLFELRYERLGFDPTDSRQPAITCSETDDQDGDQLLDCEEIMIGTDPGGADSDGDGILDWIEIVNGIDPTVPDATQDLDFDGNNNLDEIRGGTDPQIPDTERYRDQRIEYEWTDLGVKSITPSGSNPTQERSCASFEARDIQLVTTPFVPSGADRLDHGLNRILVYESEQAAQLAGTRSSTYVACFEAFYRSETSKDPESGEIDVTGESWTKLLKEIQDKVDELEECAWFEGNFSRPQIESVIGECLSDSIPLGRFAYTREDAVGLLRHYVAENLAINLPYPSSELFVPLANFNPSRHCFRPWELDYIFDLIDHILDACSSCDDVEPDETLPDDYLDASVLDQWQEAGIPNPCCYTRSP